MFCGVAHAPSWRPAGAELPGKRGRSWRKQLGRQPQADFVDATRPARREESERASPAGTSSVAPPIVRPTHVIGPSRMGSGTRVSFVRALPAKGRRRGAGQKDSSTGPQGLDSGSRARLCCSRIRSYIRIYEHTEEMERNEMEAEGVLKLGGVGRCDAPATTCASPRRDVAHPNNRADTPRVDGRCPCVSQSDSGGPLGVSRAFTCRPLKPRLLGEASRRNMQSHQPWTGPRLAQSKAGREASAAGATGQNN